MTKAELIKRHGLEWYEKYRARENARLKEQYHNDPEFREYRNAQSRKRYHNNPGYDKEYKKNDLNSNGKTKNYIRKLSSRILFDKRHHSRLKGYEIHHAFGYDDPSKFVYIPKTLHNAIHHYLRDNSIDADSNHFNSIAQLINECTEYTYISA